MTDRSVVDRVLRLYPRQWRERYGQEVHDLVNELSMTAEFSARKMIAGLVLSALIQRLQSLRSSWRAVVAAGAILVLVAGVVTVVTRSGSGHLGPSAAAATKGTVPLSTTHGTFNSKKVPDFIAALGHDGKIAGYVPREYLVPDPNQPVEVGDVAPVYASDLKTLVGYMVTRFGFVRLGESPAAEPCEPVAAGPVSVNGQADTSPVPCPSTFPAVPNISGLSLSVAMDQLHASGLLGSTSYARSSTIPEGEVISVVPRPGTIVPMGVTLTVVSSLGASGAAPRSGTVLVPNVTGLSLQSAMKRMQGKVYAHITYESSTSVPAGHVVSVTPTAGSPVVFGQEVAVVVSGGAS